MPNILDAFDCFLILRSWDVFKWDKTIGKIYPSACKGEGSQCRPSAGDIQFDFAVLDHVEEMSDEREVKRNL